MKIAIFFVKTDHVGCTCMRWAAHRLDKLLDDELYQVDPVLADLEALQNKIRFLSNCLWCCYLFPDLGEWLEDGWQVEVLGGVQVPSNVVHHLKSGLGEKRGEEPRVSLEIRGKKGLPWRCSHWGKACCSGSLPRVFRTAASAPGWQTGSSRVSVSHISRT